MQLPYGGVELALADLRPDRRQRIVVGMEWRKPIREVSGQRTSNGANGLGDVLTGQIVEAVSCQVTVRVPGEALLLVTAREQTAQELEDVRHRGETVPCRPPSLAPDRGGVAPTPEPIVESGVIDGKPLAGQLVGELDHSGLLVGRDQ